MELTSGTFAGHVGERFEVVPGDGEPFEAVLSSCEETRYGAPEHWQSSIGRVPFSLLFHAAADRLAPQQTFTLRHPQLGELALFLVPLGPDADGMRYEAVIS